MQRARITVSAPGASPPLLSKAKKAAHKCNTGRTLDRPGILFQVIHASREDKNVHMKQAGFSFFGRIGRLRYLGYSLLFTFIVGLVLVLSAIIFWEAKRRGSNLGEVCALILMLGSLSALLWVSLALQVKRLHDLDMSGYYLLGLLALGLIIGAFKVTYPDARYVEYAANLATFLIFCLAPGTPARNRYNIYEGATRSDIGTFSMNSSLDRDAGTVRVSSKIQKPLVAWIATFTVLALTFATIRPFRFGPHTQLAPIGNAMNVPNTSFAGEIAASLKTKIGGAWTGQYICQQGNTALDLQIVNVDQEHLTALFYFHPVSNGAFTIMSVPDGCFLMHGDYDPARNTVTLVPANWIVQPYGFVSVSLQGQLNNDTITGQIIGPGCSTFFLKRGDDSAERPTPCNA